MGEDPSQVEDFMGVMARSRQIAEDVLMDMYPAFA